MRKIALCLLAFAVVLSGCGTGNPPQTFDWCYRYDFTSDDYGFTITEGNWVPGLGYTTVGGNLIISHTHTVTVEPEFIVIKGTRAEGSDGDITVDASAEVFGVSGEFNGTVFGFIEDLEIPLTPQYAGTIGTTLSINISASQAVHLQSIEIIGSNFNPFGDSNCSPQPTPTANPITATPTHDPLLDTDTPSPTFTPSETPTPSLTFTPSPTPDCTTSWEHTFDFTVDDQDWLIHGNPLSEGSYSGGTGFVGAYRTDQGFDSMRLSIAHHMPAQATVTGYRIQGNWHVDGMVFSYATGGTRLWVSNIDSESIPGSWVAVVPGSGQPNSGGYFDLGGDNTIFEKTDGVAVTGYWVSMSTTTEWGFAPQAGGTLTISSLTLFGTGPNPYADECLPTHTPTHTGTLTQGPSSTFTRTPSTTPRPSRTPNIIASATPSTQCLITNFDTLNQLSLTYPPGGGSGVVSFPSGGNPPDGFTLRFSTQLDGGVHVNERAFFIHTQPSWIIQSLSYSYRVINNGTEEGSARYMWWDTGTGPARVGTSLSIGGSINWSQATISGINVSGYSGIGVEYNIVRSALSHVEIDNVQLCFSVLQTPSPSPTRTATLDIPTLDVTPTFITSTATIPPTTTLIPFPTALPTWDLTSTPEGGPEAEQVDLLTGIADSIGGFFNFIINTTLNFFNWLGSFIGWIGGTLSNFLIMLGNLLAAIAGFFGLIFKFIADVIAIIGLVLSIIWHLLELAGAWIGQLISLARTVLNTWYLAPPTPVPFLPQCLTNPKVSQVCAVWYIIQYTVLSGTVGSLLIPVTLIVVDLGIIFTFIITIRNLIKNVRGVAE